MHGTRDTMMLVTQKHRRTAHCHERARAEACAPGRAAPSGARRHEGESDASDRASSSVLPRSCRRLPGRRPRRHRARSPRCDRRRRRPVPARSERPAPDRLPALRPQPHQFHPREYLLDRVLPHVAFRHATRSPSVYRPARDPVSSYRAQRRRADRAARWALAAETLARIRAEPEESALCVLAAASLSPRMQRRRWSGSRWRQRPRYRGRAACGVRAGSPRGRPHGIDDGARARSLDSRSGRPQRRYSEN